MDYGANHLSEYSAALLCMRCRSANECFGLCRAIVSGGGGLHIQKKEPLPYATYQAILVRLGRVAGLDQQLDLYQLLRVSGRNLNGIFACPIAFHYPL
jgi:hypothetical protein